MAGYVRHQSRLALARYARTVADDRPSVSRCHEGIIDHNEGRQRTMSETMQTTKSTGTDDSEVVDDMPTTVEPTVSADDTATLLDAIDNVLDVDEAPAPSLDAMLLGAAAANRVATVKGSSRAGFGNMQQSANSRAWTVSGNVD